jgi:O-6-methylguanine DNA methyltransferase
MSAITVEKSVANICKHRFISSPVGLLTVVATEAGIAALLWENDKPDRVRIGHGKLTEDDPLLLKAELQLNEYFVSERKEFDLPLDFSRGTEFQRAVWNALLTIPFGETRTYGAIARQIGNEKAVRAVGAANGRNPISIIAPCHRVVGASGGLTGFAGGLENKKFLLDLESIDLDQNR